MADEKVRIVIEGEDRATDVFGRVKKSLGGILTTAGGFLSARLFEKLGRSALEFGTSFVTEAMEAEDITAQLNAVIASTGGVAGMTADEVNALAESLSTTTRFEDDAIVGAESLLLTFTNIGEDIFPQATSTMLDMSQALNQDLSSSAVQLGKALQDPILGVTALRRVGVNFNEEQAALIRTMVESGDVAGAQAYILKELQTEFGGSAEAAGKTFGGGLDILKNALGNVKESIGGALLPVLTELVQTYGPQLVEWLKGAAEYAPAIAEGVKTIATNFADFLINGVIPFVTTHGETLKGLIMGIGAALAVAGIAGAIAAIANPIGLVVLAIGALATAWATDWGGIRTKTEEVIEWIKPYIQGALAGIRAWWDEHGAAIVATVSALWGYVQDTFAAGFAAIRAVVEVVLGVIRAFWEEHGEAIMQVVTNSWDTIKTIFQTAVDVIAGIVRAFQAALSGDWRTFGEELRGVVDTLWNGIKRIFSNTLDSIKTIVLEAVNAIVRLWQNIDWAAVGAGVIDGIKNGILNGIQALKDAAMQAAQAALDAAKGFLGIESPSKVFAGVGANMMLGMAQGIQAYTPAPVAATTQAAQAALGAVTRVYNLNVTTQQSSMGIATDFATMQLMGA